MNTKPLKESLIKKIKDLKAQIHYHDRLYYNLDQPEISDHEYDKLFKELIELENKYPELRTKDSPSQKVPGRALEKFKKGEHSLPMLSLQNSYSKEEIQAFYNRISKLLNKKNFPCFVEPKLDGMAIELIYEKGVLAKALTRGDGKVGEDITENIKTLKGLPLNLKTKGDPPELLELRGEALIFKQDFKKINREQQEAGLPVFSNPRNLTAGSLRQLNPKVTASRPLYCFIHSPGLIKAVQIESQEEFLETIRSLSLPTFRLCKAKTLKPPLELCRLTQSIEEILDYYEQMLSLRHKLPFETDGIVIKVNDFRLQKELGAIARSPRWAMAGKFPPEEGISQVEDIRIQVGRTGVLTPVAVFKEIPLAGALIRQASLHNFQDLKRKDIRIGDFVLIQRAGDVIPELIRPLKEKRKKNLQAFQKPIHCPVCKSDLRERGDYLICPNIECPAIKENKLIHFASKQAMNIEHLGAKSLKKFYEWGWLKSFSDLYELKGKPFADKEGFGEKSYNLLMRSLETSKKTELSRFLFALGIPLIGEQAAQKISEKVYETLEKRDEAKTDLKTILNLLQNITEEELEKITDIGHLSALSFKEAFQNKELISDIQRLSEQGIHFIRPNFHKGPLNGLNFVLTGTLPEPREILKKKIEERGGQVLPQISKRVDFLIEGDNPGSKKKKAQNMNIKVLSWENFLRISR